MGIDSSLLQIETVKFVKFQGKYDFIVWEVFVDVRLRFLLWMDVVLLHYFRNENESFIQQNQNTKKDSNIFCWYVFNLMLTKQGFIRRILQKLLRVLILIRNMLSKYVEGKMGKYKIDVFKCCHYQCRVVHLPVILAVLKIRWLWDRERE